MRMYTTCLNTWLRPWTLSTLILNSMKALGYRNLNPLNIRYNIMNHWKGQTGCNKGFCTFDSMEHGFRAAFVLLLNYVKRGYVTPTQIISRWAPESENDTAAYIRTVMRYYKHSINSERFALDADSTIVDVVTTISVRKLTLLALCMSYIELGVNPMKDSIALTMLKRSHDEAYDAFLKEFWKNKNWLSIFPTTVAVDPDFE